jgi:hypothetical protein
MAISSTHHLYIPKDLYGPIAKYLCEHDNQPLGKLIQQALREKLRRDGYLSSSDEGTS